MADYFTGGGVGGGGGDAWGSQEQTQDFSNNYVSLDPNQNLYASNAVNWGTSPMNPANQNTNTSALAQANTLNEVSPPTENTDLATDTRAQDESIINDWWNGINNLLNQAGSTAQSWFDQTSGDIQDNLGLNIGSAESKRDEQLGTLKEDEAEETRKAESAMATSRREANELLTGLASRFGGTTGIGHFGGELVGRQALENLGKTRDALAYVRGQITSAMTKVKTNTETLINNLKINANNLIGDARNELFARMNEINNQRQVAETTKNQWRREALYNYQDQVSGINQRNTALEQKIFFQAQEAANKLAALNSNVRLNYDIVLGDQGWNISASGARPKDIPEITGIWEELNKLQPDEDELYGPTTK